MKNQTYFSTVEAAKLLHISRIAVFNNGQLPAEKIGRNYAITREAIESELGKSLTDRQIREIHSAVKKAMQDYRDTFERLSKE